MIGYIKEIQRAKKKGFFIKIEDISGDWEFFTKDVFNLQRFDLIILYGSKNNGRVYIDKHPMRNLKKSLDEGLIQSEPSLEQKRKDMGISKNKNSRE